MQISKHIIRPTLAVGALALAFCSSRLDLSNSLFSLSNLTAASQISSLFGFAWKARARILLAAGTSPCKTWYWIDKKKTCEPPHDKTNKMACAPSKDSDQPGHPPSLIRLFAVRMKKAWVLSYSMSAQRRLWSDWADESLVGAQIILLVLSCGGWFYKNLKIM